MEPEGGPAAADLLAARSHVRYRQRRHCRSQSAHLFLRYRHRLLAADRRFFHEHNSAHATRLDSRLGCAGGPIRSQEGILHPVLDPGSWAGGRDIER